MSPLRACCERSRRITGQLAAILSATRCACCFVVGILWSMPRSRPHDWNSCAIHRSKLGPPPSLSIISPPKITSRTSQRYRNRFLREHACGEIPAVRRGGRRWSVRDAGVPPGRRYVRSPPRLAVAGATRMNRRSRSTPDFSLTHRPVLLTPKILAVCHGSSARHRQGFDFLHPAIDHCLRRSTPRPMMLRLAAIADGLGPIARPVTPRHKKGFNADVSRCTQSTQMVRCG